jgi:hypothetical protein
MRFGDLGSGTISGTEPGIQGSLLEQVQGGKVELKLNGRKKGNSCRMVTLSPLGGGVARMNIRWLVLVNV